jgi:hypothetical protein
MKTAGTVLGVAMLLLGAVWFLQGINLLPGSFMTGQARWAIYGGLCGGAGMVLLYISRRPRRPPPR